MKTNMLAVTKHIGPLRTPVEVPIHSNRVQICAWCGVPITTENDSGWEAFVEGAITQPLCKECNAKDR